jgi:hypothetical protein
VGSTRQSSLEAVPHLLDMISKVSPTMQQTAMQKILLNPDAMAQLQQPGVESAVMEVIRNPTMLEKYKHNSGVIMALQTPEVHSMYSSLLAVQEGEGGASASQPASSHQGRTPMFQTKGQYEVPATRPSTHLYVTVPLAQDAMVDNTDLSRQIFAPMFQTNGQYESAGAASSTQQNFAPVFLQTDGQYEAAGASKSAHVEAHRIPNYLQPGRAPVTALGQRRLQSLGQVSCILTG